MNPLRCLIVDDEPDAHTVLRHYCAKLPYLKVEGAFFNALDALQFFKSGGCADVIFLDVNMPELSGFDFLKLLSPQPKIIFTTAYTNYALQSFEHNVADYLVKPIKLERFIQAVNKIGPSLTAIAKELPAALPFDGLPVALEIATILYAESSGNYVKLHTTNKILLAHATLQAVSKMLEPYGFVRIHKQYLVPLQRIASFESDAVVLGSGQLLPVGISYRQAVAALKQKGK